MIVIGIAGGVASGKSFVVETLRALGAATLDADRAGHEVLREEEVKRALHRRWGDKIIDQNGQIDRKALGQIVFAPPPEGPKELAYLEQWSHPRIGQRLAHQLKQLAANGDHKAAVLDAAVMFKAGWDQFCDKIIFVDAPRDLRLARARERGWSDEQFTAREEAQHPLAWKRSRADVVIDNSGSPENTAAQLQQFWQSLDGL